MTNQKILGLVPFVFLSACSPSEFSSAGASAPTSAAISHSTDTVVSSGTSDPTPPTESQALAEISQMSQKQCQDAFYLNTLFYQETQGMTDSERQAYFPTFQQQVEATGLPAPRPPPPPDSAISIALQKCAEGN